MKYRIRNTETDKLDSDDRLILDRDGCVVFIDLYGDTRIARCYKAEMEVAPGVYEGDYVIAWDIYNQPSVYKVAFFIESPVKGIDTICHSSLRRYIDDFEVIQCR